ncbi:hypothetical protein D1B31_00580 [Neobacillus notoginsengisoli]|uniref:Uncharacterized protein n=1 Tax=Neobacillus notoginsengisoli TaxID=1578198 RepID=A0A417YZI8_9BACI|nr:hypothetical protein [Neobacillus notoginsengisoli]RHW43206.1 hypothetical protein D1B31_00580 [Neobacillus notoginsengisoli]
MDDNLHSMDRKGQDSFTRMMFGNRRSSETLDNHKSHEPSKEGIDPALEQIDYVLLMEVIDSLADIADKLKPVVAEVYPYIQQVLKKR